jgi:hypothetical protein
VGWIVGVELGNWMMGALPVTGDVAASSVVEVRVDLVALLKDLCCWTVERKSIQQRPR